ncbi:Tetraspanin [Sergentomyia squamirostris]
MTVLKEFLLDYFLQISGVILLIFGGYILYNHLGYGLLVEGGAWGPSVVLLCLGIVTILVSWMGWNAIAKRNRCHLYLFSTALLGVILISIFITGWSLAMRKDTHGSAIVPVENSFQDFLSDAKSLNDHGHLWNRLQSEAQCCGVHGITDYIRTSIPWSCCRRPDDPSDPRCVSSYQRGCLLALTDETRQRLLFVSVLALIFALCQVLGIFMAVQLALLLREHEQGGGDAESRNNSSRNTELLPFNTQQTSDSPSKSPSAPVPTMKHHHHTSSLHESLHADLKRAQAQRHSSS